MHSNLSKSTGQLEINTTVAIVGGGLAGIMVARRLGKEKIPVVLVDQALPGAKGQLGGFARFSGAKFSMPPAGLGLLNITHTYSHLVEIVQKVLAELGLERRVRSTVAEISRQNQQIDLGNSFRFRPYRSILLSSREVSRLLHRITQFPRCITYLPGQCIRIVRDGNSWLSSCRSGKTASAVSIRSNAVFFAGGRIGAPLLEDVGLAAREAKGMDVGIRIETPDRRAFRHLRELGPDAKLLHKNCRTFCLNCPGKMHWYPYRDIMIAGGVVAPISCRCANVGLLYRADNSAPRMKNILSAIRRLGKNKIGAQYVVHGDSLGRAAHVISRIFGYEAYTELAELKFVLGKLGLIDWDVTHTIHIPLVDWYWPVFGRRDSFRTELNGLFAVGDAAGHARGLLQAAISGWLAAEDYLRCQPD